MKHFMGTKQASLLAAVVLTAGLLGACASPVQTVKAMPEDMRGNIQIMDVQVEKHSRVKSVQITSMLRQALVEELDRRPKEGQAMNLVVVIEHYQGPEDQAGGKWMSKLAGVKSHLRGRVQIVNPGTGAVIAEFKPFAEYETQGLLSATSTIDFTDVRSYVVDQFTSSVVDEIS